MQRPQVDTFVMPPVVIRTEDYKRLTLPAIRAMGIYDMPVNTSMRLQIDGVMAPEAHAVALDRVGQTASIRMDGLPFEAVRGMTRLGIRRLDANTLVLVLRAPPPAPAWQPQIIDGQLQLPAAPLQLPAAPLQVPAAPLQVPAAPLQVPAWWAAVAPVNLPTTDSNESCSFAFQAPR
jgi:hypothetical protein